MDYTTTADVLHCMFVKVINRKSHHQQKQTNFRDNTWILLRGKCKTMVNKGLVGFVKHMQRDW